MSPSGGVTFYRSRLRGEGKTGLVEYWTQTEFYRSRLRGEGKTERYRGDAAIKFYRSRLRGEGKTLSSWKT